RQKFLTLSVHGVVQSLETCLPFRLYPPTDGRIPKRSARRSWGTRREPALYDGLGYPDSDWNEISAGIHPGIHGVLAGIRYGEIIFGRGYSRARNPPNAAPPYRHVFPAGLSRLRTGHASSSLV